MMRPRSYGILNRSIARSITYALRDNNRKQKYSRRSCNSINTVATPMTFEASCIMTIITFVVIIGFISSVCH